MPDTLPQVRFESMAPQPIAQPSPNSGGANPTVASMPAQNWMNLLPRPGDPVSMAELAQKMRVQGQKDQGRNALAQLYADPNNVDAQGNLKPDALRSLGAAGFPDQMLGVMGTQAEMQQRQAQMAGAAAKVQDSNRQWVIETVADPAIVKYQEILKATGDPQTAQAAAQEVYGEGLERVRSSGRLTPQEAAGLSPKFDYSRALANSLGAKGAADQARAEGADKRAEAGDKRADQANLRGESAEGRAAMQAVNDRYADPETAVGADGKPVRVQFDRQARTYADMGGKPLAVQPTKFLKDQTAEPKPEYQGSIKGPDGKEQSVPLVFQGGQYLYKGEPVDATRIHKMSTATAADEVAVDATAQAIASYRQAPLSSYAMRGGQGPEIMKRIREINPDFDAKYYAPAVRTLTNFDVGRQGDMVRSLNVTIQHLGVFDDLAKGLGNRDTQAINRVLNYVQTQLGRPEVTNFETAKGIIADEVIKSVVGSGAVFDRESMQKNLQQANSPEQLAGQVKTIKSLMAGQLRGLRKQFTGAHLPQEEFDAKLDPETLAALEPGASHGGASSAAPAAELRPPIANPNAPPSPAPAAAAAPGAAPAGGAPAAAAPTELPPEARAKLQENVETRFMNGQVWTLRGGQPVKVR